jgi:hypothetical protein
MRFEDSAMRLRFDLRQLHLLGRHPQVDPGREFCDRQRRISAEQHLRHDLLHPCGAGLGIGGNDDVVIAEAEVVPDGGIEMMVMQFA